MEQITWQDYERLVKDIYETLGQATGVEIECWGAKCRIKDRDGISRQIDVVTKHSDGVNQYRTLISCKNWDRKIGSAHVTEMAKLVDDTDANKGVIVSAKGFSEPAKKKAEANGIGLVELRRPIDKDWEGLIRRIQIRIVMTMPRITDLRLNLKAEGKVAKGTYGDFADARKIIVKESDQRTRSLAEILDPVMNTAAEGEQQIEFPSGSVIENEDDQEWMGNGCPITSLEFKVEHSVSENQVAVDAADNVYMVMEAIFEGRKFTITNDGELVERGSYQ